MSQIEKLKKRCKCGSDKTIKDGFYEKQKITQRYLCRSCGERFSGTDNRHKNSLLLKDRLVTHILKYDFEDINEVATALKTTARTIDKYILELGEIQVKRFDRKSKGKSITLSFFIERVKQPLIVKLTINENNFITYMEVVDKEIDEKNRVKSFFKGNGFTDKIEKSHTLSSSIRRVSAFIFIWNNMISKQTNVWPWNTNVSR